ncbi:hypothetical protein PGB90_008392 [Kerria lacca]
MHGNDSFGENYLKNLQNHGVNTTFVKIINNSSGVAQIAVSNEESIIYDLLVQIYFLGENHIIIVAGANNELNASDVLEAEGAIEKAKVVLFQFETPLSTTHKGLEICAKYSCISVVNGAPGLKNLNPEILQLADIFCVNETEAELITEFKIQNIVPDSMKAATKLVSMGCKLPIITLGDKGVVFTTKNAAQPIHIPVEHVSAVDTTGAGDAFIGGLAYFLAKYEHLSMETVIKKACEIAKFSVQKFGTQTSFPERKDVLTILFVES